MTNFSNKRRGLRVKSSLSQHNTHASPDFLRQSQGSSCSAPHTTFPLRHGALPHLHAGIKPRVDLFFLSFTYIASVLFGDQKEVVPLLFRIPQEYLLVFLWEVVFYGLG